MAGGTVGGRKGGDTHSASRLVGLRRVDWVRITLGDHPPRCEVSGVGHRLPTLRVVPLAVATKLIAAGVPLIVRRHTRAA